MSQLERSSSCRSGLTSLRRLKIVTKVLEQYHRRGVKINRNVNDKVEARRRKIHRTECNLISVTVPTFSKECIEPGKDELSILKSINREYNSFSVGLWGLSKEALQHVIYHTSAKDFQALAMTTKEFSWMRTLPENFWKFMYQMRWKKVFYVQEQSWLQLFIKMDQRSSRVQMWRRKWEGSKL